MMISAQFVVFDWYHDDSGALCFFFIGTMMNSALRFVLVTMMITTRMLIYRARDSFLESPVTFRVRRQILKSKPVE